MSLRNCGLALVAMAAMLMGVAQAQQFPALRVETLSATVLDLPGDFAEGSSVVVLVYDQNQGRDVETWMPFLARLDEIDPAARYYVISALPAGLSLVRGMIEGVIRGSTSDAAQLDRTILLFTDVDALQASLGIEGTGAIHVLALDAAGGVMASTAGPYDGLKGEGLAAMLVPGQAPAVIPSGR